MKPKILFFSRQAYSKFFPKLKSTQYSDFHVVLNKEEKLEVEQLGGVVIACFEEEYEKLPVSNFSEISLNASFHADRSLCALTLPERQMLLGKTISFWEKIFSENKYFAVVHETISIEQEEVLSIVAQKHNVLDLTSMALAIDNYFYWKENPFHTSFSHKRLDFTPKEIPQEVKAAIQKIKQKGHKPFFLNNNSQRNIMTKRGFLFGLLKFEIESRFKKIKKFSREEIIYDSIFYSGTLNRLWEYSTEDLIKRYLRSKNCYDTIDDLSAVEKYFFPLHYVPEATLLYFDFRYSNQISVLEEILKRLPLNSVLVVKEHPMQLGALMQPEYLELRKRNSNLRFLKGETESHKLLSESKAVITISGSVGWEALVNNVPVIVFSNVWFDKHPDIHKPKSFDDFQKIINTELNVPKDENSELFLTKLFLLSSKGNPYNRKLYDDSENIQNIIKSIEKVILTGKI